MEDDELIQAARDGAEWAGPFLVSLYADSLLGYAHALAGDLGDVACEDVCVRAVEKAIRAIDKFDPAKGSFAAWVRGQVKFAALDRRQALARMVALDENLPGPDHTSAAGLDAELQQALRDVVRSLSLGDQAVLALREIEEVPAADVAHRLGITAAAVRQRHHRALKRLRAAAEADPRFTKFTSGEPYE